MIRRISKDRPLKILSFTDMHLDYVEERYALAIKLLQQTIREEQPDLVLFVGDNVTCYNDQVRAREFAEVMAELQVPWCPVLGNHEGDSEGRLSREEMADVMSRAPYCMMPEEKPALADGTPVWGCTNYAVPLFDEDGKICFKLIFLDGGSDLSDEELAGYGLTRKKNHEYDFLKDSQIAWYREEMRKDDCPSMIFCHIPLPEYQDAWEQGQLLSGSKLENICCSCYNNGMFDAMCEEGKTIAYVTGHDHINDFRVLYKGIQLIYNRMSGFSSYNVISKKQGHKLMQGCSVYYVDADGKVDFDDIIYHDRYPQEREEMYRVVRKE